MTIQNKRIPLLCALVFGAVLISLSGCYATSIVLPSATFLEADKTSILRRDDELKNGTTISRITDVSNPQRPFDLLLPSQNLFSEVRIAPGTYEITVRSEAYGYLAAYPRLRLQVEPGQIYYFRAESVLDGVGVRVVYRVVRDQGLNQKN